MAKHSTTMTTPNAAVLEPEVMEQAPVVMAYFTHPLERVGWFLLGLLLLGFYTFVLWAGAGRDNQSEIGLTALCFAPSCLVMGFGFLLMSVVGKRGERWLSCMLVIIFVASYGILVMRTHYPHLEKYFFDIENSIGLTVIKFINVVGS